MSRTAVLDIIASGAWNGGTEVDNSIYENQGMFFKGNIPVNGRTIEERIVELHRTKRDLADSLLEGTDTSAKLSAEQLLKLIRE